MTAGSPGSSSVVGVWTSQRQAKSNILRAIDRVAEQLNNIRAVCRKYYIHPSVLDAYVAGTMPDTLQNGTKQEAKSSSWMSQSHRSWRASSGLCRGGAAPASPQ